MKEPEKKKNKRLVIDAVVMITIVVCIALVIILLTHQTETHTTEEYDDGDAAALVCTSDSNDGEKDFFKSETANRVEHMVKLVYDNGKVEKMSYEFMGDYNSNEEAKDENGKMHTSYNIYLGENGVDHEMLTPVFQYYDNKSIIKLYLDDYRKMNYALGRIFYIGNGMKDVVAKNSIKETKKVYENKGFSCIIND